MMSIAAAARRPGLPVFLNTAGLFFSMGLVWDLPPPKKTAKAPALALGANTERRQALQRRQHSRASPGETQS